MTKREIVDETIKFYSEDPSRVAKVGSVCQYEALDGRKCAVGRCMIDVPATISQKKLGAAAQSAPAHCLGSLISGELDDVLKPEYRGHSQRFWRNLQVLHDMEDWSKPITETKKQALYDSE